MDPNSGRIIEFGELDALTRTDPAEAAKYSVELKGSLEDVERIAAAVQRDAAQREKNRAKKQGGPQGAEGWPMSEPFTAIVVLSLRLTEPEQVAAALKAIDPPNVPGFAGEARIAVGEDALHVLEWLDGSES